MTVNTKKPARPLSLPQRRQRSIDNLQRIGQALRAFAEQNKFFPSQAAQYDEDGRPLLSWRVQLLPFLGHEALYKQFKLNQPWNSPHNRQLLAAIPPEYQSPERFDDKTNYLVPVGTNDCVFVAVRRTPLLTSFEDGPENTALVLEVDDELAVPWTKPEDYPVDYAKPAAGLGNLRGGHFFLVWADGSPGQVAVNQAEPHWKSLLTMSGGERFYAGDISTEPQAEPVGCPTAGRLAGRRGSTRPPHDSPRTGRCRRHDDGRPPRRPGPARQAGPTRVPEPAGVDRQPAQVPVPTPEARNAARQVLRQIYHSQYDKAKTSSEKKELAKKLLAELSRVKNDPAATYVLLEYARAVALQCGSVDVALEAAELTQQNFQVDAVRLQTEVLEGTVGMALSNADNDRVLDMATELLDQLMDAGDYDRAERVQAVALSAARRTKDRKRTNAIMARKQEIVQARAAHGKLAQAAARLASDPDDADANLAAAEYYCFVSRRWDMGLPLLARGREPRLAELARQELRPATDARATGRTGGRLVGSRPGRHATPPGQAGPGRPLVHAGVTPTAARPAADEGRTADRRNPNRCRQDAVTAQTPAVAWDSVPSTAARDSARAGRRP